MENQTTQMPQKSNNQYYQATIDAVKRVWKYKFLWFWGILLPTGGMSLDLGSGSSDNSDFNADQFWFWFQQTWLNYSVWIIVGAVALLLLMIAFWILSIIARGGVINSLNNLQERDGDTTPINNKEEFKRIWRIGKLRFWEIFKLDLLFMLISLIILTIMSVPIFFAITAGNPGAMVLMILLAIVIFIPLAFIIAFTKGIGLIFVALAKEPPTRAVEHGYRLLMRNKLEALKLILTIFLLSMIVIITGSLAFVIVGGIFALIFGGLYFATQLKLIGIIGTSVFGLATVTLFLLIKSLMALWGQDLWLWWVKKISSIKTEEPELESITQKIEEKLEGKEPEVVMKEKTN